tara:strand:+ start:12770 stop:13423 length:654 start_codon:yes stop_codon:yes gene_type:complete
MCLDPVTLFGTSAAGIAGGGAAVGGIQTIGLLGSSGAFNLATGSLTSGLYSSVANMGLSSLMQIGSFGASAYGQAYSAGIYEQNLRQQADIYAYRAKVAENNAMMAEYAADIEADTFDKRLRALKGSQSPTAAKSGVVINQDSPLKIAADTAREGMLERLQILNRGEVAAFAERTGAESAKSAERRTKYSAGTVESSTGVGILTDAFDTGRSLLRNT